MPPRAAVVDDSPMIRELLRNVLLRAGYEVVAESGSAAAALEACRTHRPDLILLDLALPDADGLEVLPELLRLRDGVRVVVVTANRQRAVEERILAAGAAGVLYKPFELREAGELLARFKPAG